MVNTYTFQTGGLVKIGATTIENVTEVKEEWTLEENVNEYIVAGDAGSTEVEGPAKTTCELTISVYDKTGVAGTLNQFLVGDPSTGKGKTITLQPDGAGTGKKQKILVPTTGYRGMYLTAKPMTYATGTNGQPVAGGMTWRGVFEKEIPFTAQS